MAEQRNESSAATLYVIDDRMVPIGRRWRHSEIIRHAGRKYERSTEDGVTYQRLLSESEYLAGPWRRLDGEMA